LVRAGGDAEKIARAVEDLETVKAAVNPDLWDRAQESRAKILLRDVREAQQDGELREVQQGLEKLQRLRNFLDSDERAALDELECWSVTEGQRHREDAGKWAALEHLAAVTQGLA